MGKKKVKKKRQKSKRKKSDMDRLFVNPRAMERSLSDITKLLSEQEFDSEEEANAFLQGVLASGGPPSQLNRTPLEKAQDLIYEAWDSSRKRGVELARQALAVSEDCADAYVLLAQETAFSIEEAKNLYEQGVKAGERALGPEVFEEDVGHFWGLLKTRPYMRARAGLAQCLWMLGEHQKAIEHYTEMLRLNPNDNQGIRYILVNCLMEEGADVAAGKLLDEYGNEPTASWLYSRALLIFRREGVCPKAKVRLRKALNFNCYVPLYMLGKKRLPRHLPDYIGRGDENEAIAYTVEAGAVWQKTPGAIEWLANNVAKKAR